MAEENHSIDDLPIWAQEMIKKLQKSNTSRAEKICELSEDLEEAKATITKMSEESKKDQATIGLLTEENRKANAMIASLKKKEGAAIFHSTLRESEPTHNPLATAGISPIPYPPQSTTQLGSVAMDITNLTSRQNEEVVSISSSSDEGSEGEENGDDSDEDSEGDNSEEESEEDEPKDKNSEGVTETDESGDESTEDDSEREKPDATYDAKMRKRLEARKKIFDPENKLTPFKFKRDVLANRRETDETVVHYKIACFVKKCTHQGAAKVFVPRGKKEPQVYDHAWIQHLKTKHADLKRIYTTYLSQRNG